MGFNYISIRVMNKYIKVTKSSFADIVSKLKYQSLNEYTKGNTDTVSSSSDEEADGTLDLTKFSNTTENFNVYVTDDDKTVANILEKHNQVY